MRGRGFRRPVPVAVGAFAVVAVLVVAVVVVATATASGAKSSVSVQIQGNSFTDTTDITGGQVTTQTQFSMGAATSPGGSASGWFEDQVYTVASDGTLTQVALNNVKISCLSADKSSGTVWFSGIVTAGYDNRLGAEQQQQQQSIIAAKNLILVGRFQDTNSDGSVDVRSLFIDDATTAYPNPLLSSADNGTLNSPAFINGNATNAATACLLHNNAYTAADYQVVDGPTNQVQWLQPDDTTTVGNPFTGTAGNMSNPPAASVYDLSGVSRTLLSPTLYLTIK